MHRLRVRRWTLLGLEERLILGWWDRERWALYQVLWEDWRVEKAPAKDRDVWRTGVGLANHAERSRNRWMKGTETFCGEL